jgi:hypothetical protein
MPAAVGRLALAAILALGAPPSPADAHEAGAGLSFRTGHGTVVPFGGLVIPPSAVIIVPGPPVLVIPRQPVLVVPQPFYAVPRPRCFVCEEFGCFRTDPAFCLDFDDP